MKRMAAALALCGVALAATSCGLASSRSSRIPDTVNQTATGNALDSRGLDRKTRQDVQTVLMKFTPPEPLTEQLLVDNERAVFQWFLNLERWTANVLTLGDKHPSQIDAGARDELMSALRRFYTDTVAEELCKYHYYPPKMVRGEQSYQERETEPPGGLHVVERSLKVEVKPDWVLITGEIKDPSQPARIARVRETFALVVDPQTRTLKVSGIKRENQ